MVATTTTLLAALAALLPTAAYAANFSATLHGDSVYSMTLATLNYVNLTNTIAGTGGNTFLAPTNDAWTAFMATGLGQTLLMPNGTFINKTMGQQLMQYHSIAALAIEAAQSGGDLFWNTTFTNSSFTGAQHLKGYRAPNNAFTYYSADNLPSVKVVNVLSWTQGSKGSGNIQGIDTVLVPPFLLSRTALDMDLTAFAGALTTANLSTTLSNSKTGITVFAPINQAFSNVEGALTAASSADLANTLRYHVLPHRYYATPNAAFDNGGSLMPGDSYVSMATGNATVHITRGAGGALYVNGARIVQSNVLVRNGVMHLVDQVLNPAATSAPSAAATAGIAAYSGAASQTTDVPFTSAITATPTTTVAQVQTHAAAAPPARSAAAAGVIAVAAGAAAWLV